MTTDNFCLYLQNRLIQTSQTGGQWYRDTCPFSIPWLSLFCLFVSHGEKSLMTIILKDVNETGKKKRGRKRKRPEMDNISRPGVNVIKLFTAVSYNF